MKFRYVLLFTLLAMLLTACNLTLAEDVTPPPDYVPPTAEPTLGSLFPAQVPDAADGAAIYAEKCLPCHGAAGLGDGPQGLQLGVTVKAFGLPEVARPASPSQYYTTVTRGNIERFMPPFASLNDQQRWDVIAYVLTLHTTPAEIAKGKQLFEANCTNCSTDFFTNQEKMSALSEVDIARLIRQGGDSVPAFGAKLSDDDLYAVAEYLRSLSFGVAALTQPAATSAAQTPAATEGTPIGTNQASAGSETTSASQQGFGTILGSISSKIGSGMPSDLTITLHGLDHSTTDPNAGPQDVFSTPGTVNADGTYHFDNIEMPAGRIFQVEAAYSGITLQSGFGVVESGKSIVDIPALTLYPLSTDTSKLTIDEMHMFIQTNGDAAYEILALYNFHNPGDKVITVDMTGKQEIPFLKFLTGSEPLGYQAVQDTEPLITTTSGFALAPSDKPYGILAFSSVPKKKETSITQEFVLPAASARVFIPDGMKLQGGNFTPETAQDISGTVYQSYVANNIKAGDKLTFTLTGTPKVTDTTGTTSTSNNTLVFGAGGLGFALIAAGVWLYWRNRQMPQEADEDAEEDEKGEEFESAEDVMDAIIALDDLHRARKIADEAYQKRRGELKEILKGMM